MKTDLKLLCLTLILIGVAAAGCAGPANQPSPTQALENQPSPTQPSPTEPAATQAPSAESIALDMVERLNAGDVEGSLAYFADDAIVSLFGLPPTGIEVYRGKDQIRTLWEDSVSNHFQWEAEVEKTYGDELYLAITTWHDFTRQLGVAPLQYKDIYTIKDGKITTYSSWITEEALARFKPALAEVMPPEPPAAPSSAPPVSELTVTIAGGTCTTDIQAPLQAGEVKVNLDVVDQDKTLYALTMFNLDPGKDQLDLMASTVGLPPSWADILLFEELEPGQTASYNLAVEEGPVYVVCWSKPPDMPVGVVEPFEVKPVQATAEPAAAEVEGPVSELVVSLKKGSCSYTGPLFLQSGEVSVSMNVTDPYGYALSFFNLDPGKELHDLIDAQGMPAPPPWAYMISFQDTLPGTSKTYNINVEEGPVYLLCWAAETERVIDSIGPFEVAQ